MPAASHNERITNMAATQIPVIFRASSTTWAFVVIAAVIVSIHSIAQLGYYFTGDETIRKIARLLDLDNEENIPTFFTVIILLFAAQLLAVIAVLKYQKNEIDVAKWYILSFGFLAMAFDEAFRFHEKATGPLRPVLRDHLDVTHLGVLHFSWVVPAIFLVLGFAIYFIRFVFRLPPSTRRAVFIAATLYLGGAIGMELIGGLYVATHGFGTPVYIILTTIEESLEITGVIVFIYALLQYLSASCLNTGFRLGG